MAHQQQTQPYNGGGRGRGNNNNGGRGNNGAYNPNHMQQTSNYPPNMNYGGRGGRGNAGGVGGGAIPHQIGAWQPTPTNATTSGPGPVYPSHSHGNVPPSLVPGATTQQQLQSPPLGGGGIQSPPLNASLQQQQQANRTPNLQPAPPHQYGVVTPQQHGNNASQQQRLQPPPQNYNPYNNSYVQYGYPPDRQQHQWQEQQQIPYNPYGGAARTTPGGGAMYYPTMQPQQPGVVVNGGLLHANIGVPGSVPTATTPTVVPPPRPKKILTITDKSGKVIDFSSMRNSTPTTKAATTDSTAATTTTPSTSSTTSTASTTQTPKVKSSDAGSKMLQLAMARLEGKDIKSTDEIETPTNANKKDNDTAVTASDPTEATSNNKVSKDAVDAVKESKETDENDVVEESKTSLATQSNAIDNSTDKTDDVKKSSLEEAISKTPSALEHPVTPSVIEPSATTDENKDSNDVATKFRVYSKNFLLGLKNLPECMERPDDLPEMIIVRIDARVGGDRSRSGPTGGGGGGGGSGRRNSSQRNMDTSGGNSGTAAGGGGDQWARGNTAPPRRQSSQTDRPPVASPPDQQWSRGQAPPKQQAPLSSNVKGGGRSGRGSFANNQIYEDPIEPLVKSENHWRPKKNTSAFVVAEKKVKSILNKMTKEKFDRLSEQMLEIPLLSYETLNMMINHVYEKAIDEPAFGDLYANLCVRLSQIASDNKFVHIIESDEEPPTDDGEVTTSADADITNDIEGTSRNKVYRWSHDISTTDAEIIGPLSSAEECIDAVFDETERTPTPRGDMELELVSVTIKRGNFIKIMKTKSTEENTEGKFYVVYFPVSEAEVCGQQISEIFLSEVECKSDASKKNSFKRSLLNKCEEEFNKKDIYDDWQKEKQLYEDIKGKLTDQERALQESELNFRRIKIKKQMLGNVKFIGQLYKVNLLKEKIMRFCIGSMLKLEERKDSKGKNPEYEDTGNTDMDEEDHEAICNMFGTIGSTIDKPQAAEFMKVCFQKIDRLIQDKNLPSRSKFMYRDLIDLRSNNWVPRRKEEKAKTIAEIREDVEAEERRQAQLSAQLNSRGNKNDPRSSGRNDYYQRQTSLSAAASRSRPLKPALRTDDDGFTTVTSSSRSTLPGPAIISPIKAKEPIAIMKTNVVQATAPLGPDALERKIKGMRSDFIGCGGNVQELLHAWSEIETTPDAGLELVKKNIDHMMECKDAERDAIYKIIRELCEKGKLTKSDVQNGLVDIFEFIDDIVVDCPRGYEFLGILIGDMLRVKMFDIAWLCDQLGKIQDSNSDSTAPEKLVRYSLLEWKKLSSSDIVKGSLQENEVRLSKILGLNALKAIADEL